MTDSTDDVDWYDGEREVEDRWYQYVIEHGSMDVYVSLHAYGSRELAAKYAERLIVEYEENGGSGFSFRTRPVVLTPTSWEPENGNSD